MVKVKKEKTGKKAGIKKIKTGVKIRGNEILPGRKPSDTFVKALEAVGKAVGRPKIKKARYKFTRR